MFLYFKILLQRMRECKHKHRVFHAEFSVRHDFNS